VGRLKRREEERLDSPYLYVHSGYVLVLIVKRGRRVEGANLPHLAGHSDGEEKRALLFI